MNHMTHRPRGCTRTKTLRASLYAGFPGAGRDQVDAVIEKFAARRLLVLDTDTVQIAHDLLLTAWPRLNGWLVREPVPVRPGDRVEFGSMTFIVQDDPPAEPAQEQAAEEQPPGPGATGTSG